MTKRNKCNRGTQPVDFFFFYSPLVLHIRLYFFTHTPLALVIQPNPTSLEQAFTEERAIAAQEAHPMVQAVRRVYASGYSANNCTSSTETIYLVCHPDPSSGKDILLWDDIKAAFDHFVIHVRSGAVVLSFLKGADFKK